MKKIYVLLLFFSLCFAGIGNAQITLPQNTSNTIGTGSVSCNAGGVNSDSIYYRHFDLAALGYNQFDVSQVNFGVEIATDIDPAFAVTVIIFSNTGATFPTGTLTEVASVSVPILAADAGTIKTVPIVASVVAPATLVVALIIPDEVAAMHTTQFFIGSNSAGQSAPGYISSVSCGITSPSTLTLASTGFADVHVILNVVGIALSIDEFSVSKVSISPNPTSEFVNIEIHPFNSIKTVEIYSVSGQLVQKSNTESRSNISALNKGIYIIKVITSDGTDSKKLIKI